MSDENREKELEQRLMSVMEAHETLRAENTTLKLELTVTQGVVDRLKERLKNAHAHLIDLAEKTA